MIYAMHALALPFPLKVLDRIGLTTFLKSILNGSLYDFAR